MRIIAGRFGGRRLAELGRGDQAAHLRPTPDRVRESLFSMLSHRLDWAGLHVLDLFAGTGALGFEALSRGAATAHFVDNGKVAQRLIAENIRRLDLSDCATLLRSPATRLMPNPGPPCDVIFLDPPYGKDLAAPALAVAKRGGWIAPDAVVLWEDAAPGAAPDGFRLDETRRFGGTTIMVLRQSEG